jgi:hypothetical protein
MNDTTLILPGPAIAAAALLAFALSGCAALRDTPAPPPSGPVENFIIAAEPGQSTVLDDPVFGNNIRVAADSAFTSAKGEECRRLCPERRAANPWPDPDSGRV